MLTGEVVEAAVVVAGAKPYALRDPVPFASVAALVRKLAHQSLNP